MLFKNTLTNKHFFKCIRIYLYIRNASAFLWIFFLVAHRPPPRLPLSPRNDFSNGVDATDDLQEWWENLEATPRGTVNFEEEGSGKRKMRDFFSCLLPYTSIA